MDVTLPNGVVIRGVPQGTTKEQIKERAIRSGMATEADFGGAATQPQRIPAQQPQTMGRIDEAGNPAPARSTPLPERFGVNLREGFENTLAGQVALNLQNEAAPLDFQARTIQNVLDEMDRQGLDVSPMSIPDPSRGSEPGPLGLALPGIGLGDLAGLTREELVAQQQAIAQQAIDAERAFREERAPILAQRENITPWYEEEGLLNQATAGGTALAGQLIGGTPSPENLLPVGRGATPLARLQSGVGGGVLVGAATEPVIQGSQIARGEQEEADVLGGALNVALSGVIGGVLNVTPDLAMGLRNVIAARRGKRPEDVTPEDVQAIDPQELLAEAQRLSGETVQTPEQLQQTVTERTGLDRPEPLPAGRGDTGRQRRERERELADLFRGTDVLRREDVDIDPVTQTVEAREGARPAQDPTGAQANPEDFGYRAVVGRIAKELSLELDEAGLINAARDIQNDANASIVDVVRSYSRQSRESAFDLAESRRQRREQDLAPGDQLEASDYRAAAIPAERAETRAVTLIDARRNRSGALTGGEAVEVLGREQRLNAQGQTVDFVRIRRGDNEPEWVPAERLETVDIPANARMAQQAAAETAEPPRGVGTERGDPQVAVEPTATTQAPQPRRATDRISDPAGLRRGEWMPGSRPDAGGTPPPREGATVDMEPPQAPTPRLEQQTPEAPPVRAEADDPLSPARVNEDMDAPETPRENNAASDMAELAVTRFGVSRPAVQRALQSRDPEAAIEALVLDAQSRTAPTPATRTDAEAAPTPEPEAVPSPMTVPEQPSPPPMRERVTRSQAAQNSWKVDSTKDDLFQAMSKLGGMNRTDAEAQFGLDPAEWRGRRGRQPFTTAGRTPDAMREALAEEGYLPENSTLADLEALIDRQLREGPVRSSRYDPDAEMRQAEADRFELQAETETQRADREANERTAKSQAAKEARQEQQRAEADAEVNDFVLTGADTPADRAAARGQGNLLDQPSSDPVIRATDDAVRLEDTPIENPDDLISALDDINDNADAMRDQNRAEAADTGDDPFTATDTYNSASDDLSHGASQLYGGIPLDRLVAAIKRVSGLDAGYWKDTLASSAEFADGLKGVVSSPKGAYAHPVAQLWRAYWKTSSDRLRNMGERFNAPTLTNLGRAFEQVAGSGEASGRDNYHVRLDRRLNKQIRAVDKMAAEAQTAGLEMTPEQQRQLRRMLENPGSSRRGALGNLANKMQKFFEEHLAYAREAGLEVGEVKGYLPRQVNREQLYGQANRALFVKAAAKAYRIDNPRLTPDEAENLGQVRYEREVYGQEVSNPGQSQSYATSPGQASPMKARSLSNKAIEGSGLLDFMEEDPFSLMMGYTSRVSIRAELAKTEVELSNGEFVPLGDNWSNWSTIRDDITAQSETARMAMTEIENMVGAASGMNARRLAATAHGARFMSWMRTIASLGMLNLATLTSLPEPLIIGMRASMGGTFRQTAMDMAAQLGNAGRYAQDALRAVTLLPKRERLQAYYDLAEDMGVLTGLTVNSASVDRFAGGDPSSKLQSTLLAKFFSGTRLEQFTNYTAVLGLETGNLFARRLVKDLAKGGKLGANARFHLRDLNLREGEIDEFANWMRKNADDAPPNEEALLADAKNAERYYRVMNTFVEQSRMNPNAATKPAYTAHPLGAMAFQLQSWPFAFTERVLKRPFRQSMVQRAELGNMAAFYTAMPFITGMLATAGFQFAQGELRDQLREVQSGEEQAPKSAGLKAERALSYTGILGKADPVVQTFTGTRYNRTPVETLVGPAGGNLNDALSSIAQLSTMNSENTDTAERRLYEAMMGTIGVPAMQAALSIFPDRGLAGAALFGARVIGVNAVADRTGAALFPKEPDLQMRHGLFETMLGLDDADPIRRNATRNRIGGGGFGGGGVGSEGFGGGGFGEGN
jgi:hypothetical protein